MHSPQCTARQFAFSAVFLLSTFSRQLNAQESRGWLEGTVLDAEGKPVWVIHRDAPGFMVRAAIAGGAAVETEPRPNMGGLYSLKDLRPGVYEVSVPVTKNEEGKYRPQRIHGVVVKAGVRTLLNIVVHEGDRLEELGKPVATEQALIVSQELARLSRQVEMLQKQIAEWKK